MPRRYSRHFRPDPEDPTHRVNRRIRISPVRVIDPDGEQLGVMPTDEARSRAEDLGLDLVEVAPNARPPVCRIMDYGKFRYDQQKKAAANKSARVELKTVRLRPKIEEHDLDTKLRKVKSFLDSGNPVRFVMRLRGREHGYTNRWVDLMEDILEKIEQEIVVKARPAVEGRAITATIEPA